jgi:oligoendopeptidase F
MAVELKKRSEIAHADTWNAESVFADLDAWKASLNHIAGKIGEIKAYEGRLAESPQVLADFMEQSIELFRQIYIVYFYASMTQSCDTADDVANGMVGQAGAIYGQYAGASAFTDPELLAMGREKLDQWMASEPRLAVYKHYADNLFRRQAHVRSAEVEEVLGTLADPFTQIDNTAEMLTNAEIPFADGASSTGDPITVGQGTIQEIVHHPDREARRSGWNSYADGYLAYKNTLASNYAAAVKRDVFYSRARRYESSLAATLFENNIPTAVFTNLIETFQKNLPTWHKYWKVRRKALGVSELFPYDIWAPISKLELNIPFTQAVDWIGAGMMPLGDEYVEILRRGCLEERWVDIYPNVGKRQGAFSTGVQGTHPFIMTNYDGNLESVSTLAHELGHSMHSYMTNRAQPYVYTGYSLFVAEVASNFNQAMVRAHLMGTNDDPQFQIAVIEEAMQNFHRYFFIMPTLARFELEMHERAEAGDGLTADLMNTRMLELYQEGYGGELNPDGERTGITWAQFPHLYANFYVYQYATGISAANALADRILNDEAGAVENYLKFLSLGGSVYPIEALSVAGVDMTTPQAVESAFAVLGRYVDRLEQLVS